MKLGELLHYHGYQTLPKGISLRWDYYSLLQIGRLHWEKRVLFVIVVFFRMLVGCIYVLLQCCWRPCGCTRQVRLRSDWLTCVRRLQTNSEIHLYYQRHKSNNLCCEKYNLCGVISIGISLKFHVREIPTQFASCAIYLWSIVSSFLGAHRDLHNAVFVCCVMQRVWSKGPHLATSILINQSINQSINQAILFVIIPS